MKKYGKYEKMPDGTRAKQPPVKSMLLQTYFTSLLCMVLCVTMFFGTSFAWFTSEVNNSDNEIYIGTLDVGLFKQDGTDLSQEGKLFDGSIRWEPGYTALETINIRNEGDLSFRYALTFTDGKINGNKNDEELIKIARFFTVYVHAGEFTDADPKPASFADIKASAEAEDGSWRAVRMGKDPATLADILEKGFPVLSGNMEDVRTGVTDPTATLPGPNDSKPTEHTYIIALHMNGEEMPAGLTAEEQAQWQKDINELMGNKIGLNVKLTAHQRTHEEDAFNADYDLRAHVTNLGALNIYASSWLGEPTYKMALDVAYQFQPVESYDEVKNSPYKKYIADFAIWADQEIPADSVILAGYYDAWCSMNDSPATELEEVEDRWIAFSNGGTAVGAGEVIELVGNLVHYKDLCQYGNDGIGFLCGVKNLSDENVGKVITVELRLYEPDDNGDKSENYIVAGRYEYVLGTPTEAPTQMPTQ